MNYERLLELSNYDVDTGKLYNKVWRCGRAPIGKEIGHLNSTGHLTAVLDGRNYKVHRLVWLYHYKEWPKYDLDHIDGNKTNNKITNLRECKDGIVNQHNITKKREDNKSGYTGVSFDKSTQKWVAQVGYKGDRLHLGLYDSPEKAHLAYLKKKRQLHPAFYEEDSM